MKDASFGINLMSTFIQEEQSIFKTLISIGPLYVEKNWKFIGNQSREKRE